MTDTSTQFEYIHIKSMETNTAVFIGNNSATGWDANSKNQMSIGSITGQNNCFTKNTILMPDNDVLDTQINDTDHEPSISKTVRTGVGRSDNTAKHKRGSAIRAVNGKAGQTASAVWNTV